MRVLCSIAIPRHAHDYAVVAFVERGAASYWYRGAQRTAAAGQIFLVNAARSAAPHRFRSCD
jgi:quercetin dioxygenase-like cupin family protein